MRKAFYLYFSSLLVLLLVSCGKEQSFEIGQDDPVAVTGSLTMKIDGKPWVADKLAFAIMGPNVIIINGIGSDRQNLMLTLLDSIPKTYLLDQAGSNGGAVFADSLGFGLNGYSTVDGVDSSQAGGTVVVTAIDTINKTISGTFRFKVFRDLDGRQKVITEGIFSKIPYSRDLPPANATETFAVKIDNVDWSGKSIMSNLSGGSLLITASDPNASRIVSLSMPQNIGAGTYNLDLSGQYKGIYIPAANKYMGAESGKLTILEHNTSTRLIRGNFNFKAVDITGSGSAQLTEGSFSITY